MIGVGVTVVTGCGLILMAAVLYGEIAIVLLAVLGGCLLIVRWVAAGLLRLMANCDERDETFAAPDPKPAKRRPF